MRAHPFLALWLVLPMVLASCGGGGEDLVVAAAQRAAPQQSQQPQAATVALDTNALLDWAERTYAVHFPTHEPNLSAPPYTYRRYANGNYVAVAGGQVYIMGPVSGGNVPQLVGSLVQFTCRVLPQNCATVGATVSGTALGKGTALAAATVTLRDATGAARSTTSSASGTYTLDINGMAPPFVLTVAGRDANGVQVSLTSVGRNSSGTLSQRINLTPWTTALAAMLSPTGKAADLDAARDTARIEGSLTAVITYSRTLVAPSLTEAGASALDYDPIAAALNADGKSMAAFYAGLTVGATSSNAIFMANANASPCSPAQLGGCVRYSNPGAQTTTNPNVCGSDIATGAPIPCDASLPLTSVPAAITINPHQAYNFGCLGCVFWGPADDYTKVPAQTPIRVTTAVVAPASTWYAHFTAQACVAGVCVSGATSTGLTTYNAQATCQSAAAIVAQTLGAAAIQGLTYTFVCNQTP